MLAAGAGYLLARRALLPVEFMRARADGISGEGGGERLPVPAADDELRALAVTLNSLLERLEQALDREKNFVSDASHELRTPLAILKTEASNWPSTVTAARANCATRSVRHWARSTAWPVWRTTC